MGKMRKNNEMPNTDLFNKEFEDLVDNRMNELAKKLRKSNKEYIKSFEKVSKLQKELNKELNEKQKRKVEEIINTLNYISS